MALGVLDGEANGETNWCACGLREAVAASGSVDPLPSTVYVRRVEMGIVPEDMTSGQLRTLRISSSRARVWMLSEALSSLDWIVRSGRSGLLAEDSGQQDLGRGECALANGYALPMRTVIPADWPLRSRPLGSRSRPRCQYSGATRMLGNDPPRHSSLDPVPL